MSETSRGRLSNQTLLLTLGRVPILLSILILGITLARTLTTEEYGKYQAVTWLAAFIPPLLLLGLAKGIYYFLPQVREPRKFLLRSLLTAQILGLLTAGCFFLFAGSRLPKITSVIVLAAFGERLLEPVMVSLARVRRLAIVHALSGVLLLLAVLVPLLLGRPIEDLLLGVLAYFAAQALALLIVALRAPKMAEGRPVPSLGEHATYAIPMGLGGMLAQLSNHLDKVVAWFGLSLAGFSIYKRGAMEIPLLGTIAFTVLSVATPELVRRHAAGDLDGYLKLFGRAARLTAVVTLPLLVFFEITARDFIVLLYGESYAGAAVVFRLYLLLLLLRVVWPQTILETTGRAARALLCSAVLVLIHAPLSILFISDKRPWIPAGAMLLGHVVAWWGVGLVLAVRSLGTSFRRIAPWGAILRTAAVSLLGAVALIPTCLLGLAPAPRLLLSAALYFGVTLVLFRLLGVLGPEELARLREMFSIRGRNR